MIEVSCNPSTIKFTLFFGMFLVFFYVYFTPAVDQHHLPLENFWKSYQMKADIFLVM